MRHHVPILGGLLAVLGVLTLLLAPTSGSGQQVSKPVKTEEIDRSKFEELETRVSDLEKKNAGIEVVGADKIVFGEMLSNLNDDRMSRYWKFKIVLKTEPGDRKLVAEAVVRKRPEMRNWVLQFMADETVQSFSGSKNQNRIREEIRKSFGEILSPDEKKNLIREVLFEEAIIQ